MNEDPRITIANCGIIAALAFLLMPASKIWLAIYHLPQAERFALGAVLLFLLIFGGTAYVLYKKEE